MTGELKTLWESLKRDNYDVPDRYASFERTLTAPGNEGYENRRTLYESLKRDNYDVPDTYESFSRTLFEPARTQGASSPVDVSASASPRKGNPAQAPMRASAQGIAQRSGQAPAQGMAGSSVGTAAGRVAPGAMMTEKDSLRRSDKGEVQTFYRMDSPDKRRFRAETQVMRDPEDIYKVKGLVARQGASQDPFALPEMVVTPSGAMSGKDYDAMQEEIFEKELAELWDRHNSGDGENAAEKAWQAAEGRQKRAMERNAEGIYRSRGGAMEDAALLGGSANHTMNAAEYGHKNLAAHYTNFDLDRMMNEAWGNLGEEGQQALIDDCYRMLRNRYRNADELKLYKEARRMARQQSDLRLYNLAVEKNMPKGNLDYFMRKIGDMNLVTNIGKGIAVNRVKKTGDMAAYEAANEQYRQDGHKVLDVAGTVAGFAVDPTTWLSAGVGGAATKGAMWAGGRWLAGRGASAAVTQAATRQFATSMTGRIVGGIAGGAANFGTFEGVKEVENQFAHGGHIVGQDETGRYINEGYSAGAVAGQFGHGLLMGGAVGWLGPVSGNVSDKLVRATSSTVGKVATRAGVYTGATLAEGTIFSVPEWIEGERDAMDVWNDNMAMMVGFKAKHMLKSAGGVLSDLKASFDSPTNGQKNRLDFESRLRQRMDAPSDGGMALTEDEKSELKRYGYDLRDLVESSERTGDPAEGSLIAQNAPGIVSLLTDMVADPRVSEAARAKMYYFATGRRLPMSTVMRGELIEDGDGGFIVESQGANGVITSRSFKSRKAADLELERIKRQTELNSIEIGERYQQTADFENRLQEACRTVAAENGWDMVEVYRTCEEARRNHLRGGDKQFDEAQQNVLRKVTEAMGEFEETGVTDEIRGRINEKYGVDIDGAIRKEANRRTQQEQTAIDEYISELIPDKGKGHNPVVDAEAEDITNQKLLSDESAAPQGPAEGSASASPRKGNDYSASASSWEGSAGEAHPEGEVQTPVGRAVMKYQDRAVEVLSGRVVMMEDGTMVDNERSDATIVIRDISTGEIEMVSPEAILSYEEYAAEGGGIEENSLNLQHGDRFEQDNDGSGYPSGDDGGGMAGDTAGATQRTRDRSDIRVYEAGLGSAHNEYSEHSERNRREAESERLVGIAKANGQYYDRERMESLGKRNPKGTGESEVYVDRTADKVYKVKDPYAKSPMKGNVQPEDAIYEHLVHNKYFPETAYRFEGISDDLGDVRIVLSQGYVDSYGQPTQEQIEAALAEKGLLPEGKYQYGNDEVSVTDVTGDNALLGADGRVYFIDPIIDFKKPVREILGDDSTTGLDDSASASSRKGIEGDESGLKYGSGFIRIRNSNGTETRGMLTGYVDENGNHEYYVEGDLRQPHYASDRDLDNILTEYVPDEPQQTERATIENFAGISENSAETPQNPTGNAVSNVETVPNSAVPVENVQQPAYDENEELTPLQRIPRDAKGEPIFEQAENPEHGWDALVEFAEGDAATAKEIADTMADEKRKAYEKAQKQKPKGKTPTEILASKKAISAGLAQAEQEYDLWQQMANVEQRRQDAIRAQQEAEARQRAAERAEAEKAERAAREEADTTEYPLAEVIKKVLGIEYQPAKNGNNNVADGGADVALRNRAGQDGEPRGSEPPASGEQNPTGAEPSERGAGITGDSRGSGNIGNGGESQETTQQERLTKEAASGIIAEMEQRATVAPELELTIENWDAQFGENGIVSTPIGEVKMGENQFTKLMRQGRNGKLGMIKPTLEDPDIIIEDASEAKDNQTTERESSFVFVKTFTKPDGSRYYYFTSVTVSKDGHEVVVSNQEKRRNVLTNLLMKGKLVWKHADNVSPASDVADGLYSSQGNLSDPASEGTDAPQTNNVLSDRKFR